MVFRPELVALAAGAIILLALVIWILLGARRRDPEKRELLRRRQIHQRGRIREALITHCEGSLLYSTYSISGVTYSASQDIAAFRDRLPADLETLVGIASVKFLPKDPANSILVCEEWSGIARARSKAASIVTVD